MNNIFSFEEETEFNMLPNNKIKQLNQHIYESNELKLLRMASLYGANAAGKSNLVKGLALIKDIVVEENLPFRLSQRAPFKFQDQAKNAPITMTVEFIQDNTPFFYGIQIANNQIIAEELYESGVGKKQDTLIFERSLDPKQKIKLKFSQAFESDKESQLLKEILIKEFVKPDKSIMKLLAGRDNKFLHFVKSAYEWFDNTLFVILPESKPAALSIRLRKDKKFNLYAQKLISSLSLGIDSIDVNMMDISSKVDNIDINDEDFKNLISEFSKSSNSIAMVRGTGNRELTLLKEKNKIFALEMCLKHTGEGGKKVKFDLDEESDGTIRMLDFIPAFYAVSKEKKVFIVDEIERSIHPVLIKELIKKLSLTKKTSGQLIFTTHESNLLDQNIFRQDEIWFAEKNHRGSTHLYSLSSFKEHNSIDIRKGYLSGRYGSIPFVGNLEELNWV